MGQGWSWRGEGKLLPISDCLKILINCVGSGGNLALDCGPKPDGTIDSASIKNYLEIGKWLKKFGYSVYNTTAGPYTPSVYGVSTTGKNKIYIHLMASFASKNSKKIILPNLACKIVSAEAFNTKMEKPIKLDFSTNAKTISVDLTNVPLDELNTVITLTTDSKLKEMPIIDSKTLIYKLKVAKYTASSKFSDQYGVRNLLGKKEKFEAGINVKSPWIGKLNQKEYLITADLGELKKVSAIKLIEPRKRRNIEEFQLEYFNGSEWIKFYTGKYIGLDFALITSNFKASKIRLKILKSTSTPSLQHFDIYSIAE
jgi:alpha-L-fucosidase